MRTLGPSSVSRTSWQVSLAERMSSLNGGTSQETPFLPAKIITSMTSL